MFIIPQRISIYRKLFSPGRTKFTMVKFMDYGPKQYNLDLLF
jgi:hypothetical protein